MKDGEFFGRAGIKNIKIDSLCKEAQNRLIELRFDDLDELWEFRLSGKERIWGTRFGAVIDLIWWDPNHEVCPSKKKHT